MALHGISTKRPKEPKRTTFAQNARKLIPPKGTESQSRADRLYGKDK